MVNNTREIPFRLLKCFMKTYNVRFIIENVHMHGHFGDILSGSFSTPNHDSNLYIVYPFLRDSPIGEYIPPSSNEFSTYICGCCRK